MNGPNGYGTVVPPQPKAIQQRTEHSMQNGTAQGPQQYRNQPEYQHQNALRSQPSNMTQASSSSSAPNNSTTAVNTSGALKIKVNFQDDLIAIRVPSEINFLQLMDKLKERLKIPDDIVISYKDEPSGQIYGMLSDRDLDTALNRCQKLTLYVDYA